MRLKTTLRADLVRMVLPPEIGGRKKPRHCEVKDCFQATSEGKPFCTDHCENHPYVQHLLKELAAQEDEIDRVRARGRQGWKEIDVNGEICKEIINALAKGGKSFDRLKRDVYLMTSDQLIEQYARALTMADLCVKSRTLRNKPMLTLING